MASYFTLIVDTTPPQDVTLSINSGAQYATAQGVTLAIGCSDADKTGYSMKVWGIDGVPDESSAAWENYAASKSVNLTAGDGLKTVYVKLRDDVYNEATAVNDTITLNTAVPVVTITGPDVADIGINPGKNESNFSFSSNVPFTAYKVKVVPSISSLNDAGVSIGTANGSTGMSGTGTFAASTPIDSKIIGMDVNTANPAVEENIIKVFVQTEAGIWSV